MGSSAIFGGNKSVFPIMLVYTLIKLFFNAVNLKSGIIILFCQVSTVTLFWIFSTKKTKTYLQETLLAGNARGIKIMCNMENS